MKLSKKIVSLLLVTLMLLSCVSVGIFTANAVTGDVVFFKNTANWSTVNCYMWNNSTKASNATWPGVAMTLVEDNIYSYTSSGDFDMVIFNNGGTQTEDLNYMGNNYMYDYSTGNWEIYDPSSAVPTVSCSKKNGASFKTDTMDVTVTANNADYAEYSVDGAMPVSFTGSTVVTLGSGVAVGSTTTLTVSATNANGTTTESYTFTKKEQSALAGDGSTSAACDGYYGTNPNGGVGVRKTISVDGDKSDWDTSMLIAQGTANDDPRVYRENSMYEVGIDDYAMFAAWDDTNLYIMWEMANVQDVVAPNDDYPKSQGNLFQTQNLPIFIYMYTGQGNLTNNNTATGTLWDTGITYDAYVDTVIAFSTNGSNGPFIYTADENGILNPDVLVNKNTGIKLDWGNGKTISGELWGIDKAYGTYNNRVPGDMFDDSSAWVDFYAQGHDPKYDFFYEMSIPLSSLNISASDIENNGIGLLKVMTFGTSGMDCLPYDPSMNDNADQAATMSQEFNSMEKEDADHITVPLARVGKLLSGTTPTPQPTPTTAPTTAPVTTAPTTVAPTPTTTEPIVTTPPTTAAPELLGDVNGDNIVNISDVTAIQKYLALLDTLTYANRADYDGDGRICIKDATAIQKMLVGIN